MVRKMPVQKTRGACGSGNWRTPGRQKIAGQGPIKVADDREKKKSERSREGHWALH